MMKTGKIIFLLIIIAVLISLSPLAAEKAGGDDMINIDQNAMTVEEQSSGTTLSTSTEKTFTATGDTIGYTTESYYPKIYTSKAKKQIKQIKSTNKKNPTKYSITISDSQYDQLLKAKKAGKTKEIQIKTDKYITVKKPVFKKVSKKIFSKKYYKESKFKKALKKFKNKYYLDDTYKIKVSTKYKKSRDTSMGTIHVVKYKKITIIKKYNKVKSFKSKKDRITASVCVNDRQSSPEGKPHDIVYFFAPSLGIDGTMAYGEINIK